MGCHTFGIHKSKFFTLGCRHSEGINDNRNLGPHTKPDSRSTAEHHSTGFEVMGQLIDLG